LRFLNIELGGWVVPTVVFILAAILLFAITNDWNAWVGGGTKQTTDDAYLHADLTPLSTKTSGVVAKINVADYQHVKAGDLLVQVKDDEYRAQVAQADAVVAAAKAAIENNRREKQLQQAKISRALAGVGQAQAEISAAQAGIVAAQAWQCGIAQIENEGWLPRESNWRGHICTATVAGRVK
jgi:membrane fusion protein (multidrug efflux system)